MGGRGLTVPRSDERFESSAKELGLDPDIHHFSAGTRTAEDAATAIGCAVAQIVKSLVFVADDRPFLALTAGSNRADPERLATLLGGARVRRATADEAREATGYAIGGTPPFGHPRPLMVFVDRDLLSHREVWAAAGTPETVFPLEPEDLVRLTGGTVADFRATRS